MTVTSQPRTVASQDLRVTERSTTRAEWIKFRSVRSNPITLLAAGALLVGFAALFTSLAGSGTEPVRDGELATADSLSLSFAGLNLAQLVLGVLGALFIAGEYSTGMIRTMFGAVARRTPVLRAKAAVVAGGSLVVMTLAAAVAFFVGQALYGGDGATYALTDEGVLRVVLGVGVYSAGIALMGLALGFLFRSTASAIATLIGVLMIAPGLVGLLPDSIADPSTKVLPSNAGGAFTTLNPTSDSLSPGAGFAVFVAWVVVLLGVAAWNLRRRDA